MASRRRKVILILPPTLPPPTIINTRARTAGLDSAAIFCGSIGKTENKIDEILDHEFHRNVIERK